MECMTPEMKLGWRLLIVGATVLSVGCASSGAVPRPFPTPGEPPSVAAPVPAPTPDGYTLSGTALALRGAPYRNGGATPDGFDCSGFVQYVYAQHGVGMPREVREQFRVGKSVAKDQLEPGDLVFFSTVAPGASHVGIAIDRDQFIHAPSTSGVVRVERLSAEYWDQRFIGARRPR